MLFRSNCICTSSTTSSGSYVGCCVRGACQNYPNPATAQVCSDFLNGRITGEGISSCSSSTCTSSTQPVPKPVPCCDNIYDPYVPPYGCTFTNDSAACSQSKGVPSTSYQICLTGYCAIAPDSASAQYLPFDYKDPGGTGHCPQDCPYFASNYGVLCRVYCTAMRLHYDVIVKNKNVCSSIGGKYLKSFGSPPPP